MEKSQWDWFLLHQNQVTEQVKMFKLAAVDYQLQTKLIAKKKKKKPQQRNKDKKIRILKSTVLLYCDSLMISPFMQALALKKQKSIVGQCFILKLNLISCCFLKNWCEMVL